MYKYKLEAYARRNQKGLLSRLCLSIYPQNEDLLIGEISQAEFGDVDGQFTEDGSNFSDIELENIQLQLNKQFIIRLRHGVIQSFSVDSAMTADQINQLKVVVSQFQIDTNAQNVIPSEDNHLPNGEGNNAFYKTMEPTAVGDCETIYDISPIPEYLVPTHPEWVPLPKLKDEGDLIKIEKTINLNNCTKRGDYLSYMDDQMDDQIVLTRSKMDYRYRYRSRSILVDMDTPLTTRIVISGDLRTYTIQSAVTTSKAEDYQDVVSVTLESVERATSQPELRSENLINIGNLVLDYDTKNNDTPAIASERSNRQMVDIKSILKASTRCQRDESMKF